MSYNPTELLRNFQKSLQALVPMAERIGMTWQNDEAYDEWEGVEAALFNAYVIRPLIFDRDVRYLKPFVPSMTDVRCLDRYSYIQHLDVKAWVFLGFRTQQAPFDSCWLQSFDPSSLETASELILLALADLKPEAVIHTADETRPEACG